MSTTIINKSDWIGTKANYTALSSIDTNKKYYITDLETFVITNAAMATALTNYSSLYAVNEVFICIDSGIYEQWSIYQIQSIDNVKTWIKVGSISTIVSTIYTISIPTTSGGTGDWQSTTGGYNLSKTITGLTVNDSVFPSASDTTLWTDNNLDITTSANTITLFVETLPSATSTLTISVIKSVSGGVL